MKVVLNISELLESWKISQEEYDKILLLSSKETRSIFMNIFVVFGVSMLVIWLFIIFPSVVFMGFLSIIFIIIGLIIQSKYMQSWWILVSIFIIFGTLWMIWVYIEEIDKPFYYLEVFWFLALMSYVSKSSFLASLTALSIAPVLWMMTSYGFVSYGIFSHIFILAIIVYGSLAWLWYFLSQNCSSQYEKLCIIFSRTCLLMINFAFLVASHWWDDANFYDLI